MIILVRGIVLCKKSSFYLKNWRLRSIHLQLFFRQTLHLYRSNCFCVLLGTRPEPFTINHQLTLLRLDKPQVFFRKLFYLFVCFLCLICEHQSLPLEFKVVGLLFFIAQLNTFKANLSRPIRSRLLKSFQTITLFDFLDFTMFCIDRNKKLYNE
jgi:hypothetical protein